MIMLREWLQVAGLLQQRMAQTQAGNRAIRCQRHVVTGVPADVNTSKQAQSPEQALEVVSPPPSCLASRVAVGAQ